VGHNFRRLLHGASSGPVRDTAGWPNNKNDEYSKNLLIEITFIPLASCGQYGHIVKLVQRIGIGNGRQNESRRCSRIWQSASN
jgi:hypothetical protein